MIVKVVDIPPEGLEIEFPLDESVINQRISASESPDYRFLPNAHVKVRLNAEGQRGGFGCGHCDPYTAVVLLIYCNVQ